MTFKAIGHNLKRTITGLAGESPELVFELVCCPDGSALCRP
jgi:hypothetical protein